MTRPNSRELILDTAEAVVLEYGAAHLTLDTVAAQAGLSKGGLLYNFPSKEALLQAMYERVQERFEADQESLKAKRKLNDLEAYVSAAVESKAKQKNLCAAIVAAGANNPQLLEPVKKYNKSKFDKLAKSKGDSDMNLIVLLATHGLWFLELLDTSPLSPAQRKSVTQKLTKLCRKAN